MDKKFEEKLANNPEKLSVLLQGLANITSSPSAVAASETPKSTEHKFWKTQPVPQSFDETVAHIGPLEEDRPEDKIRKIPLPLPEDFEWVEIDIQNPSELSELHQLLCENYVEDVESLFRFAYPDKFLEWALMPPNWKKDWHVGVRVISSRKLVAFVSAVPVTVDIRDKKLSAVEVNFLCVIKKLRSKRLAPVLIKEITRRVNLTGIYQALYTAGIVLPTPLSSAQYFHRSLNPKKLVETGFSAFPVGITMPKMIQHYALPKSSSTLRVATIDDVPEITALYKKYYSKFLWKLDLSENDVKHWIMPLDKVVYTYVKEHEGKITDFVSFFILPSSVIGNDKHKDIVAAYLFYYAVSDIKDLCDLIQDAMSIACDMHCDVFNCLEIMDNSLFLKPLKFGPGDGRLQYYMFNWSTPPVSPNEVAVIML